MALPVAAAAPFAAKAAPWVLAGLQAIPGLAGLFGGGGDEQKFQPTGTATTEQFQLGPESERELMLAMLAERLAQFGGESIMGGGPIRLEDLIAGRIGETQRGRFDQLVFGDAFGRAIRDAERVARESAASRGLAGGTGETQLYSRLVQPTLETAGQARIGLEMGELDRLSQLRENLIANSLAFQNMPALERLTGLRLATGTRRGFSVTQQPERFTPYWGQTQFTQPNAVGI